jgi:hypothetical protein
MLAVAVLFSASVFANSEIKYSSTKTELKEVEKYTAGEKRNIKKLSYKLAQLKFIFNKTLLKGKNSLNGFWLKTCLEATQTKQAGGICIKCVQGKEVTVEERKILWTQVIDIAKVILIGVPYIIIPGFTVVLIVLVKIGRKYKFNVLPSAFASELISAR